MLRYLILTEHSFSLLFFSILNIALFLDIYNELSEVRKDLLTDTHMEVESGVEAFEDNLDGFGEINDTESPLSSGKPSDKENSKRQHSHVSFGPPPSKHDMKDKKSVSRPNHFSSFSMYFLTFLIFISFILCPNSNIWNGFVLGLWFFCFTSSLKSWILDTFFTEFEQSKPGLIQLKRSSSMPPSYTIPSVKEHTPIKKYEVSNTSIIIFSIFSLCGCRIHPFRPAAGNEAPSSIPVSGEYYWVFMLGNTQ